MIKKGQALEAFRIGEKVPACTLDSAEHQDFNTGNRGPACTVIGARLNVRMRD